MAATARLHGAGAVTLLAQILLPVMLHIPCKEPVAVRLVGGTCVAFSPPLDHLEMVLLPLIRELGGGLSCAQGDESVRAPQPTPQPPPHLGRWFGIGAHLDVRKRGYFPRGGGDVVLRVSPNPDFQSTMNATERGEIVGVRCVLRAFGFAHELGEDTLQSAAKHLRTVLRKAGVVGRGDGSVGVGAAATAAAAAGNKIDIQCFQHDSVRGSRQAGRERGKGKEKGKEKGKDRRGGKRSKRPPPRSFCVQIVARSSTGCLLSANALVTCKSSAPLKTRIEDAVDEAANDLVKTLASRACVDEVREALNVETDPPQPLKPHPTSLHHPTPPHHYHPATPLPPPPPHHPLLLQSKAHARPAARAYGPG